jgi:hypothetical protein
MSQDLTPSATKPSRNYNALLIIIAALLLLLTALNAFQVITTYQQNRLSAERAATHAERVKAAEALVTRQQSVISSLMDDYQKAAYDNPAVERIAEQQLLASESTLAALQVIAIQNSQVLELLATAP